MDNSFAGEASDGGPVKQNSNTGATRDAMTELAAIEYPPFDQPAAGQIVRVADGVFWLRMPLPFQLDHINLWLLEDGDGYTLIDSGIAMDSMRAHWDTVLGNHCVRRPISRIIVTHYHPDHLGLAAWLAERLKVPVAISQGELLTAHCVSQQIGGYSVAAMVAQFTCHGLDRDNCEALLERGNGYRRIVPSLPSSYDRLMEGDQIRIGAHDWRVMMGYGHSPEHAALYCAQLGLLIGGDMVLPRISTNVSVMAATPLANPLRLFLDSLTRFARLPTQTLVLPSHGKPFQGLQVRARALAEHHRERCDELINAATEPRSSAALMPVLFKRELDNMQIFFAMGETIAHLNFLTQAGLLQRESDKDGSVRFVKTMH